MIVCNARVLDAPLTGIQRYTIELLKRLPDIRTVQPSFNSRGALGHLWEQTILPFHVRGELLWSPSNTGPLAIRNQVVTVHDLGTFEAPDGFSPGFRAAYSLILPRLVRGVRAILTPSHFIARQVIERFSVPAEKVRVTHLGVDHDKFRPQPATEIERVKEAWKIPGRYLLFIGPANGRKNLRRLLQAWSEAQQSVDADIELLVAGGSASTRIFNDTVLERLPARTRPLPYIPDQDLPALLAGATLFAFPSLYEGFGLPTLEAMACGTPVLTSSTTSLSEVAGRAALTVSPTDTRAIAKGIVDIVSDPARAQKMREQGLVHARQFSWDTTARQTWAVISEFSKVEATGRASRKWSNGAVDKI